MSASVAPVPAPVPERSYTFAQAAAFAVMVLLIAALPATLYPIILMEVLCFALFASAFNLLVGQAGLLSFGHAAFFGMGSYVAAYGAASLGLTPELAILSGGVVGALLGAAMGWLAIRRQGVYFTMITLALAQLVYFFCLEAPFTAGENGIQGVPRGRLFGVLPLADDRVAYALVACVFLAGFLLIQRIVRSPFGQVLQAIRDNEMRATSLGYRTEAYKLLAFVLSSALAGIAGGTKAVALGFATLSDVHWSMSGAVILMTLLGGLGTVFGPAVGAAIVVAMQHYLAGLGDWVTVAQGAVFVACVLAFRRGIIGELAGALRLKL